MLAFIRSGEWILIAVAGAGLALAIAFHVHAARSRHGDPKFDFLIEMAQAMPHGGDGWEPGDRDGPDAKT